MTTNPTNPQIGEIVDYTLSELDAAKINQRRVEAPANGNKVSSGAVYPMMVVQVWSNTENSVNGQVFLDGDDVLWATSVAEGDGQRHWRTRSNWHECTSCSTRWNPSFANACPVCPPLF